MIHADRFAEIALGHVTREYPHKLNHVLMGPPLGPLTPSSLHPVFHGSFDWHSCVHGYWLLATLLRTEPTLAQADAIRALFDARLTPALLDTERDNLLVPGAETFERPYGWAWLLMLAAELSRHPTTHWAQAIAPLATLIAERWRAHLARATYPVRHGAHANTAFALALSSDYAHTYHDQSLLEALRDAAQLWYGGDVGCQTWEPGGDEFLSPALMEAEAMRRLLPAKQFSAWFDAFLPDLGTGRPACLFTPAEVSDRRDGKIVHLDGLNLSRAWCLNNLAGAPGQAPARASTMRASAERHLQSALEHIDGDYMGAHWLASFAALALRSVATQS
ncbi:DUF2891 domain-containing protein [Lichenicoccus sp.]|uniref:DUF2891 domain-containing protein n=1 Tax=Lichenicoccus sp. TaxID=2781899 RepID=UPI003D0C9EEA